MRLRIQPWPWFVQFRQYSAEGKASKPRIVDAKGKPVRLSNARQATLAAMAPVLLDRLTKLCERAEMMHMQVQSALALNLALPPEVVAAREAVDVASRL